jgi:hypothetical protein
VLLPGNHDIELQWPQVHAVIRTYVGRALASRPGADPKALERLRIEPWFHHEPGRIWIEHGCQYDPECAFRYPLRGALATGLSNAQVLERDVPLGNFTQRYLYNAFGPITFIVPSTRANARYVRWLLLHEPRLLLRVIFSHVPFIAQVIRRLSQAKEAGRRELQHAHETELDSLATASGLGDTLREIDGLKRVTGDLVSTVRQQGWAAIRFLLLSIFTAFASTGLWFSGFLTINALSLGFGPKSVLFIMLNLIMMAVVLMGGVFLLLRSAPDRSMYHLREGARQLVNLLDVPVVTFGHTHDEIIWRLERPSGGKAWYYNTGTWIAVFTDDVLLPRERVQFTFLRMRDLAAELLYWSPGRRESLPVILLDEIVHDTAVAPTTASSA